jgi:hypothetical protein
MYDEFEEDSNDNARRRPPTWQVVVLAIGAGLLLIGGAAAVLNHSRVQHSNQLAAKYGLASSTSDVSVQDRCVASFRDDYDNASPTDKAALPPGGMTLVAPRVCALAVQNSVVRDDGSMTYANAKRLAIEAINQMGKARFQTLVFNELAIKRYHLAASGHATRQDRCYAMGYSGYDALPQKIKNDYPPRPRFFHVIRDACTTGIAHGLVPNSGAPSRNNTALLITDALRRERCRCK